VWAVRHGRKRSVAMRDACGFTLIEALIAMVLVGLAITALLVSNQSFTAANGAGLELSTAEFLIEQIREQTVTMPFGTLVGTFNSTVKTYSPPHDSQGNTLTAYSAYSQRITGQYVNASDLRTVSGSGTPFYRITVEIRFKNELISSASWLRANY
jgi:prepilin-type N-terminal cleavage/methylation domain-containing protein